MKAIVSLKRRHLREAAIAIYAGIMKMKAYCTIVPSDRMVAMAKSSRVAFRCLKHVKAIERMAVFAARRMVDEFRVPATQGQENDITARSPGRVMSFPGTNA